MLALRPENLAAKLVVDDKREMGLCLRLDVRSVGLPVDRDFVAGWLFGPKQKSLAERLLRCIQAGKAFTGYDINTDVNGKTYVSAEQAAFFHKQHMNKSLKSLGF